MPIKLLGLLTVLALVLLPTTGHAKRLALVIDQYEALPKLERAVNDADAIARTLEGLGFEVIDGVFGTGVREAVAAVFGSAKWTPLPLCAAAL